VNLRAQPLCATAAHRIGRASDGGSEGMASPDPSNIKITHFFGNALVTSLEAVNVNLLLWMIALRSAKHFDYVRVKFFHPVI